MGEWRGPRGWSRGKASIWRWMSGEALSRDQLSPSALMARDSWVRGTAEIVPSRSPRQFGHPQFHCGNPPPAAEPRTRISTVKPRSTESPPRARPAGGASHRDLLEQPASFYTPPDKTTPPADSAGGATLLRCGIELRGQKRSSESSWYELISASIFTSVKVGVSQVISLTPNS